MSRVRLSGRGLLVAEAMPLLEGLRTMSRPPVIPAEKKIRIVLSVLQGEISIAEAALAMSS